MIYYCMHHRLIISILCASLLVAGRQQADAQRGNGHRITNTRIVVDSNTHWRNWQLPTHAVDVTSDGSVVPHFFRERYDILDDLDTFTRPLADLKRKKNETAILNIDSTETLDVQGNVITQKKKGEFIPIYSFFVRPGISRVGSNLESAAHILDDDPTTYWEPDPDDPLENWWIEVDLGRVVPVDSVILHFVDEELGDPFRQFRILTAPDQENVYQNVAKVDFVSVGGTEAPNRDQRTFSFPLEQLRADPNWTGRLVETIRIVVTDTKAGQGRLLSEEEWLALPPADRGDIVYFIRDQQGFEEPVERETYESLPPERQGRKDFYLRERPRLAGIEVLGYGDNISPGMVAGGGSLFLTGGNFAPGPAFDGDFTTNFLHLVWSPTIDRGVLTADMGATFWLDAMRISSSAPRLYIDGYTIRGSDGSRDANGRLKWRRLSPREREDNSVDQYRNLFDIYPSPFKLRYLEMIIVSANPTRRGGYNTGPNIAEYQLFSSSYPAEVILTSDLIELPAARNFGAITWEAETPPGTTLEIRTRTGDLLGKVIRYFDKSGTEITYDAWKNLLGSFKGPADTTFVPTSGWSSWSRPYRQPGDRVTSPGLRKYMEIQVKMITEDRETAASIKSINVELLKPVAERILAELWPAEVSLAGQVDTFEVFAHPNFIENPVNSRSAGFDEILLTMPASRSMELLELELGAEEEGSGLLFSPSTTPGLFVAESGAALQVLSERSDSIWVRLPTSLNVLPETSRIYYRVTSEGEEVPVTQDGLLLSGASYGLLEEEEKGAVRYFRRELDASGDVNLTEVDQLTYQGLERDQQAPIRYFRILRGDGAQFPFDANGDSLDAPEYNRLQTSEKGRVIGSGQHVRMRFSAPVFLNGTTLKMAVRNTAGGTDSSAPWQNVEPGDAIPQVTSNTLSINVPLAGRAIDAFDIIPNPFTPNQDGINDETEIHFSVFKITDGRQVEVRIYTLDGRSVWETAQTVTSGTQSIRWSGTDRHGNRVPPGLYICQIDLDVDDKSSSATRSQLISVAY